MTYRKASTLFCRHCRVILLAFPFFLAATSAFAQNSISGIVFDQQKKPVGGLEIELLDGFERLVGSRKTTGSGFYTFQRLNAGIYYLRVRPGGSNFKESKMRVDLVDLNAIGGVDQKQVDIFLEVDDRRGESRKQVTGVVFAQDIPSQAKKQFENARKLKEKKPEEALEILKDALRIFPDYFDALEMLGDVSLELKRFQAASDAYERALRINPHCFGCYFNLGIAFNSLGEKQRAADALRSANSVDSGSINAHLLLGIVLREIGSFSEAEATLLRAKELCDNKQPDVNWQLAELYYFDLKKPRRAISELRRFLENLTPEEKRENPTKIESIRQLIRKIESES